MGIVSRAVTWVKTLLGLEPRVLKRRSILSLKRSPAESAPKPGMTKSPPGVHVTSDEACVRIGDLTMWVRSSSGLDIPYELTVVVPRADVTRRYVEGQLIEVVSSYSSITIARSPRPLETSREGRQRATN